MTSDTAAIERLRRLRDDFLYYGPECLKIRTKEGEIKPFALNEAQQEVHRQIEQQKAVRGWVRALILKGRQQGISTYVGGRYYGRASLRRGVNVYILSHEQTATDTLFGMVDRYQRNNPLAPHVGVSNAKELVFDRLDSSYAVATAGTKAGGRSKAISLFHGSEVAFWQNAHDHFAASVQGVPLAAGTEIILESTSAGSGGEFYERWQDAEAGRGDYICIFLPWWLSSEYAREPDSGFVLSAEADEGALSEQEYADMFLVPLFPHIEVLRKMAWRRNKIIELRSVELFQREYPATPAEAWTAPPGKEPYISPVQVLRARKRTMDAGGPLIIGVDPASNGGDRFSIAARRGNKVLWVRYRNKIDTLEGAIWVKSIIDEMKPARVNIDMGNIGAAIVTNLKAAGPYYAELVRGVNFGATSEAKTARPKIPGPINRRAEMWTRMKDWLPEGDLPDGLELSNALQTDLTAPRQKPRLNNDFTLESKTDMKARQVRSPDLGDSVALTFAFTEYFAEFETAAEPIQYGGAETLREQPVHAPMPEGGTSWMS